MAEVCLIIPGLSGAGAVKLRVQLARQPAPSSRAVGNLITGGILTLPVGVTAPVLNRPAPYYRVAHFALKSDNAPLAAAEAKGEWPTSVLVARLTRGDVRSAFRALAGRPSALTVVADLLTGRGGAERRLRVQAPLHELASGFGADLDRWVQLEAPDPVTSEYRLVPPRLQQTRGVASNHLAVAPMGKGYSHIASVAAVSQLEAARPSALAAHVAAMPAAQFSRPWLLGQLTFIPSILPLRLPRVDDPNAMVWPDCGAPANFWYVPAFSVVMPNPSQPVTQSPFLFRFETSGHGPSGEPGINATVTFTLQRTIGDDVAKRLQELGKPPAQSVKFTNLAVTLSIPFRDENGQTQRSRFTAQTDVQGDKLVARVALLDNWARLAYGALAVPNFQSEPPRIRVDGCFEAMVSVPGNGVSLVLAPKRVPLPALLRAPEPTLATGFGTIRFVPEAPSSGPVRASGATRPLAASQLAVHSAILGQVLHSDAPEKPLYGRQTLARSQELACLYPCATLGAYYVQTTAEGDTAIGCREAFQLGQTEYREYAPVNDVRIPAKVKVFRSLQQPGHFLLAAASYKITRFGPDAGDRAFRPAAFLYSSLDAVQPENNRCLLLATVGPDLAPHEFERLRDVLRDLAPSPVLQYITEIDGDANFIWSLPNADVVKDKQATRLWDSFQMSLAVNVPQAPVLDSMLTVGGIAAAVNLTLPDKTVLQSTLMLDLNTLIGPAITGPVEAIRDGNNVRLTNRIEGDVDVDDLLLIDDAAAPGQSSITTVTVEKTLKPGETVTFAVSASAATRVVPVATQRVGQATSLAEIRSFVEDIYCRLAFINLVNYGNHGLSKIALEARLVNLPASYVVPLSDGQSVATLDIVLPLTQYLNHPVLEFQATLTRANQGEQKTAWITWPLETKGNVIGLTPELVGLTN